MQEVTRLINICHKVYEKGFVAAYDGNLSCRTEKGNILITRSAICKGEVTEKDIIEIDIEGNKISGEGRISTEVKIHLNAYHKRKDLNAVIHNHPPYSTAAASIKEEIPENIFPEVILLLGKIARCSYATPSTESLAESMNRYIDKTNIFLLNNHGAVTLGSSIEDAYYKMEKLEHTMKILYLARTSGTLMEIPKDKVEELKSIAEKVYGIHLNR
ncbi:MAG TPA: class II aldolase/adducin family protein [Ignavibacteriaceae bacterium]|nr:class II aldolase/adducin family protein [Ignavibacteriaceae bacterium]